MESNSLFFLYDLFLKCDRISIDSRQDCKNVFFVAIRGEKENGNKFAQQAIEKGAKYAVVDQQEFADPKANIFYVEDTLVFLQQLAIHHRGQFTIPVIGITGTNGKTTTKELIYAVLSKKYKVLATQGNLNNHIGVPLTVLQLTDKHQIAVIEMGASRLGEIKELCEIADPTHGLITNIGEAHLEGFGTIETVIETKRELYNYVAKKYGTIFVDIGNTVLKNSIPRHVNKVTYKAWEGVKEAIPKMILDSFKPSNDGKNEARRFKMSKSEKKTYIEFISTIYNSGSIVNGFDLDTAPYMSFLFMPFAIQVSDEGRFKGVDYSIQLTNLFGGHNIFNCLAAMAVGVCFKVPIEQIGVALEAYTPSNNRSQVVQTKTNTLLVDCYNANPSSMDSALQSFHGMFQQNDELYAENYVILGDMLELGDHSMDKHREIVNSIEKYGFKGITVGKNFTSLQSPNIEHQFETIEQAIEFIKENPIQNKWILLKGSRGVQLEQLIDYL